MACPSVLLLFYLCGRLPANVTGSMKHKHRRGVFWLIASMASQYRPWPIISAPVEHQRVIWPTDVYCSFQVDRQPLCPYQLSLAAVTPLAATSTSLSRGSRPPPLFHHGLSSAQGALPIRRTADRGGGALHWLLSGLTRRYDNYALPRPRAAAEHLAVWQLPSLEMD